MDLLLLHSLILIWASVGTARCLAAPRSGANIVLLILALASGGFAGVYLLGHTSRLLAAAPVPSALAALPRPQPSNALSLFVTELVLTPDNPVRASDGLLPTEGPYAQWNMPYSRWMKKPVTTLTIPPTPQLARLQLSFGVCLHLRPKALLEVRFNGQVVQTYRIESRTTWLEQTLELMPQPGANVLEFRDVPPTATLDWQGYLERYPDVRKHLVTHNLQLQWGALEHYEVSGRAEGRIMDTIPTPAPENISCYFVFRKIQLEGFKSP